MRRIALVAIGMVIGAVLFQGARLVRRQMLTRPAVASHSHGQASPDWTSMSDADLEIARVMLIARQTGVGAALDTLSALVSRDSIVANIGETGLHQVAHSIGRYAATRTAKGVNAFADCRPGFLSGCPHGVIEGYFSTRPHDDSLALNELCDRIAPKNPAQWPHECAHGVGHGLFQTSGGDVAASVSKCGSFAGNTLKRECLDGVFMSAVQRDVASASHSNARRCRQYDGDAAIACWYYEASYLIAHNAGDLEKAMRECPRTPDANSDACFNGFGRQMVGMKRSAYEDVAKLCRAAADRAASCIEGAVTVYTDDKWSGEQAKTFCAVLSGGLKTTCDNAVVKEMTLKGGA